MSATSCVCTSGSGEQGGQIPRSPGEVASRGGRGGRWELVCSPYIQGPSVGVIRRRLRGKTRPFVRLEGSLWQMYPRGRLGWGGPIKAGHFPTEHDKLQL